jgi:hypothetical protein
MSFLSSYIFYIKARLRAYRPEREFRKAFDGMGYYLLFLHQASRSQLETEDV